MPISSVVQVEDPRAERQETARGRTLGIDKMKELMMRHKAAGVIRKRGIRKLVNMTDKTHCQ